jgi:hypothetical protein
MEVSWLGVHAGSLFDNDTKKQTRRQAARIVPTSISRGGNICLCEFVLTSKRLGNSKSTQLFSGKKATTSTYRTLHFPFSDLIFAFFCSRFPSRSSTPCAIHLTQVPKLLCGINVKISTLSWPNTTRPTPSMSSIMLYPPLLLISNVLLTFAACWETITRSLLLPSFLMTLTLRTRRSWEAKTRRSFILIVRRA